MADPFSYLPVLTPDYTAVTLTVIPANKIEPVSDILQREMSTDGGSPKTSTMKDTPDIILLLSFLGVGATDRNIISDMYHNPSKALKSKQSFGWQHPVTEIIYTSVFVGAYQEILTTYGKYDVNVTLRVIGKPS
jgi:hypothetical protein